MGAIMKYTCKACGYVADDVAIGPGFAAYQEAVVCRDCGEVFSKPLDKDKNVIPKYNECHLCGGHNLELWHGECPKCGNKDMDSDCVGLWD